MIPALGPVPAGRRPARRATAPDAARGAPRQRPPRLFPGQPLLRLLVLNALAGFLVAFLFVGLLLWFDVAGFAGLIARSQSGPLALAIVTFGMCVTFGSAAMGGAVMLMDYDPPTESDATREDGRTDRPPA